MLASIGPASRRALIDAIVPPSIARPAPMDLPAPLTEPLGGPGAPLPELALAWCCAALLARSPWQWR